MMWGKSVVSNGAVGIALLKSNSRLNVNFDGVRPITGSMQVTASIGNIIESLDNSNPTRLLLQALGSSSSIDASGMASYSSIHPLLHESVYLGTIDPTSGAPTKMYKITAGDPSRGPLSLEAGRAPLTGEFAQVCREPTFAPFVSHANVLQFFVPTEATTQSNGVQPTGAIDFVTVAEGVDGLEGGHTAGEATTLDGTFFAASDAGLLVHRPEEDAECLGIGGPVGARARIYV